MSFQLHTHDVCHSLLSNAALVTETLSHFHSSFHFAGSDSCHWCLKAQDRQIAQSVRINDVADWYFWLSGDGHLCQPILLGLR
jgi:hypothetical protein